jgi:cobalt-zinc-cadmium efflux system membrane fusion protein
MMRMKSVVLTLLVVGVPLLIYFGMRPGARVSKGGQHEPPAASPSLAPPSSGPRSWDGLIEVDPRQREAIGVRLTEVRPQTEPVTLELPGTTTYDPDSEAKIRPRFDTLVRKVHARLGQTVKKGDPLIELYSAQLAEVKASYETKRTQWLFDKHLLEIREALAKQGAVSKQLLAETQNDEMKSRVAYKIARDELLVYGLTEQEIDNVPNEEGSRKAMMTLRSPIDGTVINRDAVPGNLYDTSSVLMVIASLDHFWVWVNVYEGDLRQVQLGQVLEIQFPFLDQHISGKLEYVANEVDPETHAVRVRATIPNSGGALKADMLVRSLLEIPPAPDRTIIPRLALVTTDGASYAFVRRPDQPDKFERRPIRVVQERSDHVVVEGLRAGEEVVTNGALWMAQLYEDRQTVQSGAPPGMEQTR